MVPGKTATAALVHTQEDRGGDGIGDQPSARVWNTEAAEAGALASETRDAGRLQYVALTHPNIRRICAKKEPNERRR